VTAWYVAREGESVSPDELERLCRSQLSPYKVPKVFNPIERLPRNSMGKILRRELRASANKA
jgi:acyl-CoA synthetase (AMP-forming)/AMP-acid ligase II